MCIRFTERKMHDDAFPFSFLLQNITKSYATSSNKYRMYLFMFLSPVLRLGALVPSPRGLIVRCVSLPFRSVPSGKTWSLAASRVTTSRCCCCTLTRVERRCQSRTCPRVSTCTTSPRPVTTAKTRVTTTQLGVVVVARQQTFR